MPASAAPIYVKLYSVVADDKAALSIVGVGCVVTYGLCCLNLRSSRLVHR